MTNAQNNEESAPPYETSERTIYGNLVADPKNESKNPERYFVPLRVANNNRNWKGLEGEFYTTVLVTGERAAQNVLLTLKQGMPVIVSGRESVEEYQEQQRATILIDKRGGHISLDLNRCAVTEEGVLWGKRLVEHRNAEFGESSNSTASSGTSRPAARPAARPTSGAPSVTPRPSVSGGSGAAAPTARPRPGGATARPKPKVRSN